MKHTDRSGPCWLWTGHCNQDGYGRITVGGVARAAHRVSYEVYVGPIPEGLALDHLCRVRRCINPAHLEPVTQAENNRRARKSECINGHPFNSENTGMRAGRRYCKQCHRTLNAASYRRTHPRGN